MGVSLKPSTFVEGGLIDDVDVTVKSAAFVMWNYNGKQQENSPALGMTLVDTDGKEFDQYFSAGDAKYFAPSADDKTPSDMGPFLIAVGEKAALNHNTNTAKFVESLVNAGFPESKLDGPISILEGLQFHLKREAVKRTGLVRTGKNADREQTVVTCSKIIKLPWENGSSQTTTLGKPAANKPVAVPAKTNGAATVDMAKLGETVLGCVMEAGGEMPKAKLGTAVFAALKGDPDQKSISAAAFKDDVLKSIDGIKLENGVVKVA